ncbi:MAG: HAD-IIIA family hydrolase [Bacteroidota bacterium]
MRPFEIDQTWTLFLDRDGVINHRIPGAYVRRPSEFKFLPGVKGALAAFTNQFSKILIVTNQQGVGKGLMTQKDLDTVHHYLKHEVGTHGGRLDGIYACTGLASDNPPCRKPNPGMGAQAKADFPEIDFKCSIMVGDSLTDILFGQKLGMKTVFLRGKLEDEARIDAVNPDLICADLWTFSQLMLSPIKNKP